MNSHSRDKREELELEFLEKRLAELEPAEQTKSEPEETNSGSYADIFGPAKEKEGKRTPRTQRRNDPRDNVQKFKVGDYYWDSAWKDAHLERQLIPYPQYPNPGEPFVSFEEEQRYEDESNLWLHGKLALERCIWHHRVKRDYPHLWNNTSDDSHQEDMLWMTGVLQGRGLPVITEDQLQKWVDAPPQYATMENRRPFQIPEPAEK